MPKLQTNYRWQITSLLFAATTINYLDRQVISLLKPTLERVFIWTETDYSHIVMAFQGAYALSFVTFGWGIDRIGSKIGYSISVFIWSIAAMLHAIASNAFSFGIFRALLGLGEGGNFPASIKAVTEWFPQKERAFATGIFNSGTNIGAVVAPLLVPWILGHYGWQAAFLVTGAIGFIWLIFWWIYYESPARHKKISAQELVYIGGLSQSNTESAVNWLDLLKRRQTWAFIMGKLLTDPVWWFFLFWLPSFLAATFHVDLTRPSLPLIIIYSSATIGSVGGGYITGYFLQRGWSVNWSRKIAMFVFALCIVPIMVIQFASSLWQVIGLLSLAVAAHQAWSANLFTLVSDLFPKKAVSSVVGIGGMAGSLGGLLFPILVGSLLDTYKALGSITTGYNILFVLCGSAYLVALLCIHLLAPSLKQTTA
ncbi:MFS transporter [Spirosoma endbachense]|uniref:MFS transporter n=1 Tax=Spirosoma endbachense TaxID=2666025 RepID=A0A6P1VUJ7_9BACT|nr:MFS transporter [Spirosoma endbachense]QHV96871.1 MFS transporter [Spirosoma endbachense]